VGVDVAQPGGGAGLVDEPGDGVPVQCSPVLPGQQQRVLGGDVGVAVVADEGDQVWVQGQVAVFAEFADRDVELGPGADKDDGVSAQVGELADA
jgi:hypothetical protein